MKRILFLTTLLCVTFMFSACKDEKKAVKWEYKTIRIAINSDDYGDACPLPTADIETELNILGEEGWELVSAVPVVGTTFPNFGNSEYVTGLRDLTATRHIQYVLKRELKEEKPRKEIKKEDLELVPDSDTVTVVGFPIY